MKNFLFLFSIIFGMLSCKSNIPPPENVSCVITTVTYQLGVTKTTTGESVVYTPLSVSDYQKSLTFTVKDFNSTTTQTAICHAI